MVRLLWSQHLNSRKIERAQYDYNNYSFLAVPLDRGRFSGCILNPGTSCICMSRHVTFSSSRFLLFASHPSSSLNENAESIETMENHAACERVVSVLRIRYFFGLLFSRWNSWIWRIDNGTRFRRRAIPYHGIIPYRRITHYQRTNIFV